MNHILRSSMACVAGDKHTGQAASGPWQICVAQSKQKRLWPHGTKAAITWLSIHWMHISCPLPTDPSPGRQKEDSGGEDEDVVLSPEEEKAELEEGSLWASRVPVDPKGLW